MPEGQKFQFHKGTIKTGTRIEPLGVDTKVSIP